MTHRYTVATLIGSGMLGLANCGAPADDLFGGASGNPSGSSESSGADRTSAMQASQTGSVGPSGSTAQTVAVQASATSASTGQDPCENVSCQTPPSACYSPVGMCQNGVCMYAPTNGAPCNDADPCTTSDTCLAGTCAGSPVTCNQPPAPVCIGPTTLRTYSNGSCEQGECKYMTSDMACDAGCQNGACSVCDQLELPLGIQGNDPTLSHGCGGACDTDWCACIPCLVQSGPGLRLVPGQYRVEFLIGTSEPNELTLEVFDVTDGTVLASATVNQDGFTNQKVDFNAPLGCHEIDFRVSTQFQGCVRIYNTHLSTN